MPKAVIRNHHTAHLVLCELCFNQRSFGMLEFRSPAITRCTDTNQKEHGEYRQEAKVCVKGGAMQCMCKWSTEWNGGL